MSISKQKNGLYGVRVTKMIDGRISEKRTRNIKTKGAARNVENELKFELESIARKEECLTWKVALDKYLPKYKRKVTYSTFYTAEHSLVRYTGAWNDRPIQEITTSEIEAHIDSVHECSTDATKASLLKYIRGVFSFYLKSGAIKVNPANGITYKKSPQKKLLAMSRSEIITLLRYTKETEHPWHSIFRVTYELGLRSGEALALTWDDIDFENKRVAIYKSYCGKSKVIKSTKNEEVRTVVLNDNLVLFLKELHLARKGEQHVLPQINKWKRGEAAQVIYAIQDELNIKRSNFHSLRASFITHLLSGGVPIIKVQAMVGHKEFDTTQRYVRLTASDLDNATDNLSLNLEDYESKILEFKK